MTKKDTVFELLDALYDMTSILSRPSNKDAWKEQTWARLQSKPTAYLEWWMKTTAEILAMPSEE